jgi:hypothetical protein
MELSITILRELWRHRLTVVLFALVAVSAGGIVAYRPSLPPQSRGYHVGSGHLQILVDTPASQVVEIDPEGSDSLGSRAGLIASLMVEGEVKASIAKHAGLRPEQLVGVADTAIAPATVTDAQLRNPKAHVIQTSVVTNDEGAQLPIIGIETQAPDAKGAAMLANAAASGLKEYLDSRAARESVPDARRLQVRELGVAQARDVARGPGHVLAAVAAVMIFGALCGTLLLLIGLVRGWHDASKREQSGADDVDIPSPAAVPQPSALAPYRVVAPRLAVAPPLAAPRGGADAAPRAEPQPLADAPGPPASGSWAEAPDPTSLRTGLGNSGN